MPKSPRFAPFTSNLEYLSSTLDYLAALARQRTAEQRLSQDQTETVERKARRDPEAGDADAHPNSTTEPSQLPASVDQARRLARQLQIALDARTRLTLAAGTTPLPLETLAAQNGLGDFEKLTMATVLGWSLDHRFKEQLTSLCSHLRRVEVRVILELLCDGLEERIRARKYFISTGRLTARGLLTLSHSNSPTSESEFMEMNLELPRQISSFILGEFDVNDQLISFSSVIEPEADLEQVVLPPGKKEEVLKLFARRDEYLDCRRAWGLDRILSYGKGMVILFSGPSGTGKTMLAHALAKATGHRLMLVDVAKISDYSRRTFDDNLRCIFHEARLRNAIVFFDEADELFSSRGPGRSATSTLLREFERLEGICILATNRPHVLDEAMDRRIVYKLEFDAPSIELREEIWRKHLPAELPLAGDVDIRQLAEEFDLTGGLIKNAVLLALQRAVEQDSRDRRVSQEDLRAACYLQVRNRMSDHADKIVPKVTLNDVVLPDDVRAQIRAVINAVRQRSTVYVSWGFGRKMSLGRAITVLLSGESGVGKSMTAEAIACELGQSFYAIRLSSMISPWVGQTGRNITAVFDEAKASKALLFFDEAEALFSARLNESSHHAQYINERINTLLTAIERFDGVVILATNRAEAFDKAFERRIRHRINLPHPDAAIRARIWQRLLPAEAPVARNMNFALLGQRYDFTGGTIRNVILRAAFAAASNGRAITQSLLERCAEDESPLQSHRIVGFASRRTNARTEAPLDPAELDPLLDPAFINANGEGEP